MVDERDPDVVARRLGEVEDRLALLDLEGAYGPAYDSRQGEAWAALFTEDGIYQGRRLEGMPAQNFIRGRANLTRFCDTQGSSGMHSMASPQLALDGDRAIGRVHFRFQSVGTDVHDRTHAREVTGYYDVGYERTPAGWRMARRITNYLEIVQRTTIPYEQTPADVWAALPDDLQGVRYQDTRT